METKIQVCMVERGGIKTQVFSQNSKLSQRYNNIDSILTNETTVSEPAVIREEIIGFFQNLYRENEHWRPQFNPRDQAMLNEEDNLFAKSIGEQEIKECVFACCRR